MYGNLLKVVFERISFINKINVTRKKTVLKFESRQYQSSRTLTTEKEKTMIYVHEYTSSTQLRNMHQ